MRHDHHEPMDLFTLVGLTGVVCYVIAYALLQLGMIDGNGAAYSVANIAAASLVLVSLTRDFNLASALTQIIWIAIGVGGLLLRFAKRPTHAPVVVEPTMATQSTLPMADTATSVRASLGLLPDSARATSRPTLGLAVDTNVSTSVSGAR